MWETKGGGRTQQTLNALFFQAVASRQSGAMLPQLKLMPAQRRAVTTTPAARPIVSGRLCVSEEERTLCQPIHGSGCGVVPSPSWARG
jgi:hypothetical protein